MELDEATRYFAGFNWTLARRSIGRGETYLLHDHEGAQQASFSSLPMTMGWWAVVVAAAHVVDQSAQAALLLAGQNAKMRDQILGWARSGDDRLAPRHLQREIDKKLGAQGRFDWRAEGPRLAPLISGGVRSVEAEVLARLSASEHRSLQHTTQQPVRHSADGARL